MEIKKKFANKDTDNDMNFHLKKKYIRLIGYVYLFSLYESFSESDST